MEETSRGAVSTGSATLDRILDGGFPHNRSILITGGPGTGKSTLSMQFLQEGIREGDDCLFVSTEQTPSELRDTFAPFDFDLDHERLTLTSVHARPGYTLDSDEEQLTIETLEGDQLLGEGYSAPYSSKYICQMLGRYAPADRVVIDSVSGLRAMADDDDEFRRAVLDLVRLFSDEFEATALLVAEGANAGEREDATEFEPLQYTAHGVVRLWIEEVRSDLHRFLQVVKMRGIGHDTRTYEIEFSDGGVFIIPRNRDIVDATIGDASFTRTNIPGFDELLGGGFVSGRSVVFQHDGQFDLVPLFVGILKEQFESDSAVLLMASQLGTDPERLAALYPDDPDRITELLDTNQLFIVDVASQQEPVHDNIYTVGQQEGGIEYLFELIENRSGARSLSTYVDTEAATRQLGAEETVALHQWQEMHLLSEESNTVYIHNPDTVPDTVGAFFGNNAAQVIDLWRHDNGLQYLTLSKSPTGYVGTSRLVDNVDDPPFVRIQSPPGPATNPEEMGDR